MGITEASALTFGGSSHVGQKRNLPDNFADNYAKTG